MSLLPAENLLLILTALAFGRLKYGGMHSFLMFYVYVENIQIKIFRQRRFLEFIWTSDSCKVLIWNPMYIHITCQFLRMKKLLYEEYGRKISSLLKLKLVENAAKCCERSCSCCTQWLAGPSVRSTGSILCVHLGGACLDRQRGQRRKRRVPKRWEEQRLTFDGWLQPMISCSRREK